MSESGVVKRCEIGDDPLQSVQNEGHNLEFITLIYNVVNF